MSKTVSIHTSIGIPAQSVVIVPRMMFIGWFPNKEADYIVAHENEMTLKLWFDASCTLAGEIRTAPSAANAGNSIKADVTVSGVRDELAAYMHNAGLQPLGRLEDSQEKEEFVSLGERVYHFVYAHVNRLISTVRSVQGQYWLEQFEFAPEDFFLLFGTAKASIDGLEWFRWYPPQRPITSYSYPRMDTERFIDEAAWRRIARMVTAGEKVSLVWQCLADADSFAANGDRRAAIVEGVTALEVATSRFVQNPKANEAFGPRLAERMGVNRLVSQKERLGLRGTVRFLFAVILSEEMVSTQLLKTCQDAVDERNAVVHNGQPDVEEEKLRRYLASIRQFCAFLAQYELSE